MAWKTCPDCSIKLNGDYAYRSHRIKVHPKENEIEQAQHEVDRAKYRVSYRQNLLAEFLDYRQALTLDLPPITRTLVVRCLDHIEGERKRDGDWLREDIADAEEEVARAEAILSSLLGPRKGTRAIN